MLGFTNLVNSNVSKTLQHFDVLGICISKSVHLIRIGVCIRTYRRGLRCCLFGYDGNTRASEAEQQQCSPAFFIQMPCVCMEAEQYLAGDRFFVCLLLSMSNFSLDIRGILRTSRYGEKLFMDLVTDSKRTNKNQSVSCPHSEKVLPL